MERKPTGTPANNNNHNHNNHHDQEDDNNNQNQDEARGSQDLDENLRIQTENQNSNNLFNQFNHNSNNQTHTHGQRYIHNNNYNYNNSNEIDYDLPIQSENHDNDNNNHNPLFSNTNNYDNNMQMHNNEMFKEIFFNSRLSSNNSIDFFNPINNQQQYDMHYNNKSNEYNNSNEQDRSLYFGNNESLEPAQHHNYSYNQNKYHNSNPTHIQNEPNAPQEPSPQHLASTEDPNKIIKSSEKMQEQEQEPEIIREHNTIQHNMNQQDFYNANTNNHLNLPITNNQNEDKVKEDMERASIYKQLNYYYNRMNYLNTQKNMFTDKTKNNNQNFNNPQVIEDNSDFMTMYNSLPLEILKQLYNQTILSTNNRPNSSSNNRYLDNNNIVQDENILMNNKINHHRDLIDSNLDNNIQYNYNSISRNNDNNNQYVEQRENNNNSYNFAMKSENKTKNTNFISNNNSTLHHANQTNALAKHQINRPFDPSNFPSDSNKDCPISTSNNFDNNNNTSYSLAELHNTTAPINNLDFIPSPLSSGSSITSSTLSTQRQISNSTTPRPNAFLQSPPYSFNQILSNQSQDSTNVKNLVNNATYYHNRNPPNYAQLNDNLNFDNNNLTNKRNLSDKSDSLETSVTNYNSISPPNNSYAFNNNINNNRDIPKSTIAVPSTSSLPSISTINPINNNPIPYMGSGHNINLNRSDNRNEHIHSMYTQSYNNSNSMVHDLYRNTYNSSSNNNNPNNIKVMNNNRFNNVSISSFQYNTHNINKQLSTFIHSGYMHNNNIINNNHLNNLIYNTGTPAYNTNPLINKNDRKRKEIPNQPSNMEHTYNTIAHSNMLYTNYMYNNSPYFNNKLNIPQVNKDGLIKKDIRDSTESDSDSSKKQKNINNNHNQSKPFEKSVSISNPNAIMQNNYEQPNSNVPHIVPSLLKPQVLNNNYPNRLPVTPSTPSLANLLLSKYRRRSASRRSRNELALEERWVCTLCKAFFRKTSTRSIQEHKVFCYLTKKFGLNRSSNNLNPFSFSNVNQTLTGSSSDEDESIHNDAFNNFNLVPSERDNITIQTKKENIEDLNTQEDTSNQRNNNKNDNENDNLENNNKKGDPLVYTNFRLAPGIGSGNVYGNLNRYGNNNNNNIDNNNDISDDNVITLSLNDIIQVCEATRLPKKKIIEIFIHREKINKKNQITSRHSNNLITNKPVNSHSTSLTKPSNNTDNNNNFNNNNYVNPIPLNNPLIPKLIPVPNNNNSLSLPLKGGISGSSVICTPGSIGPLPSPSPSPLPLPLPLPSPSPSPFGSSSSSGKVPSAREGSDSFGIEMGQVPLTPPTNSIHPSNLNNLSDSSSSSASQKPKAATSETFKE